MLVLVYVPVLIKLAKKTLSFITLWYRTVHTVTIYGYGTGSERIPSPGGALCRSMSPNFNVPNINVLHINGSLLQPWLVEVQSTLALPKALQINGSIHQRKKLEGHLHSNFHYFTPKISDYNFLNKTVELQFLVPVLPCLKSDIQRSLVSNKGN